MCCMKNDVGNVVSDADGMKNILRKYMAKLLNVENDWDVEVDYHKVMGPCCFNSEEEVATAITGLKIGKAAGPTGVVNEMYGRLLHPRPALTNCKSCRTQH